MPQVSSFLVLSQTGKAVIDGDGFDVCLDNAERSATLIGEYDEQQFEIPDQAASFCEDMDGRLIVEDSEGNTHAIDCYRLVPVSLSDI